MLCGMHYEPTKLLRCFDEILSRKTSFIGLVFLLLWMASFGNNSLPLLLHENCTNLEFYVTFLLEKSLISSKKRGRNSRIVPCRKLHGTIVKK